MKYLLDTNVVVWLLLGERDSIPSHTVDIISATATIPMVSAASVWEIAIKRSLGKLDVEPRWLDTLLTLDFEHLPVTAHHAAAVENLPWHHRDPFDRLLIAQAAFEKCPLVTANRTLDAYEVETLWA